MLTRVLVVVSVVVGVSTPSWSLEALTQEQMANVKGRCVYELCCGGHGCHCCPADRCEEKPYGCIGYEEYDGIICKFPTYDPADACEEEEEETDECCRWAKRTGDCSGEPPSEWCSGGLIDSGYLKELTCNNPVVK